jgi:hypothetical protein
VCSVAVTKELEVEIREEGSSYDVAALRGLFNTPSTRCISTSKVSKLFNYRIGGFCTRVHNVNKLLLQCFACMEPPTIITVNRLYCLYTLFLHAIQNVAHNAQQDSSHSVSSRNETSQ